MSVEVVGPLHEGATAVDPHVAPPVGIRALMVLSSVVGLVLAAAVAVLIETGVFRGTDRK